MFIFLGLRGMLLIEDYESHWEDISDLITSLDFSADNGFETTKRFFKDSITVMQTELEQTLI